jgi:hypothetical protein
MSDTSITKRVRPRIIGPRVLMFKEVDGAVVTLNLDHVLELRLRQLQAPGEAVLSVRYSRGDGERVYTVKIEGDVKTAMLRAFSHG